MTADELRGFQASDELKQLFKLEKQLSETYQHLLLVAVSSNKNQTSKVLSKEAVKVLRGKGYHVYKENRSENYIIKW